MLGKAGSCHFDREPRSELPLGTSASMGREGHRMYCTISLVRSEHMRSLGLTPVCPRRQLHIHVSALAPLFSIYTPFAAAAVLSFSNTLVEIYCRHDSRSWASGLCCSLTRVADYWWPCCLVVH